MTHKHYRQIDLSKLILFDNIHNYNYYSNQNRQLVKYQICDICGNIAGKTFQIHPSQLAQGGEALCVCIYLLCQHLFNSSTIVERTRTAGQPTGEKPVHVFFFCLAISRFGNCLGCTDPQGTKSVINFTPLQITNFIYSNVSTERQPWFEISAPIAFPNITLNAARGVWSQLCEIVCVSMSQA